MSVSLTTGREAISCICASNFITAWKALFEACSWSTACQHPDFIIPWYQIYAERCIPVIVFERNDDGSLRGILALALIGNGKTLVGAGMAEAEYQCWIEHSENNGSFIRKAMPALKHAFPHATIHLRYLNRGAPLAWLKSSRLGYFHFLKRHQRPLMELSASNAAARLNGKTNRGKINKLKKYGDISFQRLEDHEAFIAAFDEIRTKYDLRQQEKYSVSPFRDDALKGKFHIEMHKRGLLHVTVLNVGNEIAAFHSGLISRDWLHLGVTGQDACFERHSPGRLQLLMLAAFLDQEKFSTLDLTPGGDEYKELLATQHDEVYELSLFPTFAAFTMSHAKHFGIGAAKSLLRILKIQPVSLRRAVAKFRAASPIARDDENRRDKE